MSILFTISKYLIFSLLLISISCSSNSSNKKQQESSERSVEEIYNSAMDYINDNKYSKAHDEFVEVERLHPYSIWATRSQIMTSYVNYKLDKYADSFGNAPEISDKQKTAITVSPAPLFGILVILGDDHVWPNLV